MTGLWLLLAVGFTSDPLVVGVYSTHKECSAAEQGNMLLRIPLACEYRQTELIEQRRVKTERIIP